MHSFRAVPSMPGLLVVSIDISDLQTHAIMGKNGSGKSTLSKCLVGHPDYEVTEGTGKFIQPSSFYMHHCYSPLKDQVERPFQIDLDERLSRPVIP